MFPRVKFFERMFLTYRTSGVPSIDAFYEYIFISFWLRDYDMFDLLLDFTLYHPQAHRLNNHFRQ